MEPPSKIMRLGSEKQMSPGTSKEGESLFNQYIDYVSKNGAYNPIQFFKEWSQPASEEVKTPPRVKTVVMKDFNAITLRDNVFANICKRNCSLHENTIQTLIKFLSKEFVSLYEKIYLQIFVHYTKMNITGVEYDNRLRMFMNVALETTNLNSADIVALAPKEMENFIKRNLVKPPMISSFKQSLAFLFGNKKNFDDKSLIKIISDMDIYVTEVFFPLSELRGACLLKGILICSKNIASRPPAKEIYDADLITLAGHETCHHLGRIFEDDFNLSSPYKTDSESEEIKHDSTGSLLEMGRYFELKLFDDIQPAWNNSLQLAAVEFLKRLDSNKLLPLIKKEEFETLGLESRMVPSASFGIDLKEEGEYFF